MSETKFVGYEYKEKPVKTAMVSTYVDGYENFGWKLDETAVAEGKVGSTILKLKRNRKINNRTELAKLQRQFDACAAEIVALEESKNTTAFITAMGIGIVGTVFMAGSVFAVVANQTLLCIILAVPAFVGWTLPYFTFKKIQRTKILDVTPLIDNKFDEMYVVCEKAHRLLEE